MKNSALSSRALFLISSAVVSAALGAGCGSSTAEGDEDSSHEDTARGGLGGAGAGADEDEASSGGSEIGTGGQAGTTVTAIHFLLDGLELEATFGLPSSPVEIEGTIELSNGKTKPLTGATWTSNNPNVVSVDANGEVTATGNGGGPVVITVRVGTVETEFVVNVKLSGSVVTGGLGSDAGTVLEGGALVTSGAPAWQYPEAETLFPARMTPPTFQWAAGGNVAYRLVLARGQEVSFTIYTDAVEYQPTPAIWAALTAETSSKLSLTLEGKATLLTDADRHGAAPREVATADAALSGDVYFFPNFSDFFKTTRLDLEKAEVESLFADQRCRSCHTVSRDGSRLAFEYDGGNTGLTDVVSTSDSAAFSSANSAWTAATFSPSGASLIGVYGSLLKQYDTVTGIVEDELDVGTNKAAQPSWSVDGSRLAMVVPPTLDSDYDFPSSSLFIASLDRETGTFEVPTLLASADDDENRDTITAPTWSPDSRYLAVGLGIGSYSATTMTLSLVDVVKKTRRPLTRGASATVDESPSFAPRAQGGFYWLLFTSDRAYGHKSTNKQLWVMAIDPDAADNADPSYPAFWIPGQNTASGNLLGQWAPNACGGQGEDCASASECCGGLSCLGDADEKTCQADACAVLGDECDKTSDCCVGADTVCRAALDGVKVCQPPLP